MQRAVAAAAALLLAALSVLVTQQTTTTQLRCKPAAEIWIIRHGERPLRPRTLDLDLSPAGVDRAKNLNGSRRAATGHVSAVYATSPSAPPFVRRGTRRWRAGAGARRTDKRVVRRLRDRGPRRLRWTVKPAAADDCRSPAILIACHPPHSEAAARWLRHRAVSGLLERPRPRRRPAPLPAAEASTSCRPRAQAWRRRRDHDFLPPC